MLDRDNRLAKTLRMATEVVGLIVNDTIGNRKGWISLFSRRPLGREEYQRTFIIHGYAISTIIPQQRRIEKIHITY